MTESNETELAQEIVVSSIKKFVRMATVAVDLFLSFADEVCGKWLRIETRSAILRPGL